MSKKDGGKRGSWDSIFGSPFGGFFDFNGDGKEDLVEQWLGYEILKDIFKEDGDQDSGIFDDD